MECRRVLFRFTFKVQKSKNYVLIGKPTGPKVPSKFDKASGEVLSTYSGSVVLKQKIRINSEKDFDLKLVFGYRSEEHTSELQSRPHLVCRLLLEKKKYN